MTGDPAIIAEVDDRQSDHNVDASGLGKLLERSLHTSGVRGPAEVGLAFIDEAEMAELNRHHMGGDGPTDVLAFPIDGLERPPDGQPAMVGDIVICPVVADRAPQPLVDELSLLVVHGALHLLGHDHAEPDERAVMQRLERELLAEHHAPLTEEVRP
ncbi:MAG: rRNA maturation RNase YbeY [Actinomycetota bacterium]